jgi:Tol biopolymer transport system component
MNANPKLWICLTVGGLTCLAVLVAWRARQVGMWGTTFDRMDEFDYYVSWSPSISADGRYVVFSSSVPDLVQGLSGTYADLFLCDRRTGKIECICLSYSGGDPNDGSSDGSISADGHPVVFSSRATNLTRAGTNGQMHVFVRDREKGVTERVSVSSEGEEADHHSFWPVLSADGRYVAFRSWASNLVPGDTNAHGDIFVRDRAKGKTERVNISSGGEQANGETWEASISADGRYVVFASDASNLVPNDTNAHTDVFLHDRRTHTTECVSLNTKDEVGDDNSGTWGPPAVSSDGRWVAFMSAASDLVPDDTNGCADVFVRDRIRRTTRRVSISSSGQEGNAESGGAVISADGRFVAFESEASNLVPGDRNERLDVFVHDLGTHKTERISILTDGLGDRGSANASISADGRYVAFEAEASPSVTRETKLRCSVYVRDRKTGKTECVSIPSCSNGR